LFQSTAEGRYTIALDLPAGPLTYACDKELITQAMVNLVHNSVRHCPGPVHIVMRIEAGVNEVAISVADDGPGIPPADRERVLKRFVRLDTSRSTPGTGLGLSLVAAIAELHGGRIEILDNRPGLKVAIKLPRG